MAYLGIIKWKDCDLYLPNFVALKLSSLYNFSTVAMTLEFLSKISSELSQSTAILKASSISSSSASNNPPKKK